METATPDKPRFRCDLVSQQLEVEGVQYVDVSDPNSGATFRFYEIEYQIACAMNGERDVSALVAYAQSDLGIDTSGEELGTVVSTLLDLGYLDTRTAAANEFELGAPGKSEVEFPTVRGGGASDIELGAPGGTAAADDGPRVKSDEVELGAAGGDGPSAANAPRIAAAEVELGAPGKGDESPAAAPPKPAGPPPPPGSKDDMDFGGLLGEDATSVGPRPAAVSAPAKDKVVELTVDEPESKAPPIAAKPELRRQSTGAPGGDDEPTNLPGAMPEPDDDDVSVDLSAHLSLDKNQVQEAVRASKVIDVPEMPADLLKDAGDLEEEQTKQKAAMPLPPPPSTAQLSSLKPEPRPEPRPEPKPVAAKPIDVPKPPPPATAAPSSGGGSMLYVVLLLLAVGGFGVYWFVLRDKGEDKPSAPPSGKVGKVEPNGGSAVDPKKGPDKPPDTPPKQAAAPRAQLSNRGAGPLDAKAPAAGRIGWLATPGVDVKTGEPIVKLQGFQRWEQQKSNALDRLAFYQDKLDKATAANDPPGVESAKKKVDEKQGLVKQAEDELAKLVTTAPGDGKVELLAALGAPVAAGAVVARVAGEGPQLIASFESASGYGAGSACELVSVKSPDKRAACVIEIVEGTKVTVRALDGSGFAAGDDVTLAPPK